MITSARRLSPRDLAALAELETRVVASDGGRLKLEWSTLRSRSGRDVEDFLWWDGDRMLGFLGLYAFGSSTVEIAGMVDPSARRRGIATALLDAALPACRDRQYKQALLIVPRGSAGGPSLASRRRAELDHSEHGLRLVGAPADGPTDERVALRVSTAADVPQLSRLLAAAFGEAPSDLAGRLASATASTLVVQFDGAIVGTVRVTLEQGTGRVHGFAVDPAWQGRGIGRDVLLRVCRGLCEDGARQVELEVEVDNDHALRLYTSLGFTRITTEDYYALAVR